MKWDNCMKLILFNTLIILSLLSCQSNNEPVVSLDGVSAKVFKVDTSANYCEVLKETVYDPKTDEGKSKHKVYWTHKTRFIEVSEALNFKGIKGSVYADFNPTNEKHAAVMISGKSFYAKTVTVTPGLEKKPGLSKDKRHFVALFTPDPKQPSKGSIVYQGKKIEVKLRTSRQKVLVYKESSEEALSKGLWKTRMRGEIIDNKFVCDSMQITSLPDPRETDDPKLPRVLVIGDSISMNYHEAAKSALKGIVNYHRIEGNGGPSDRGASSVELWLGGYKQKGFHWDVIQFNHGLHDLKQPFENNSWGNHQVSLEDYKKNLKREIEILRKTGANLIWCSTTPVPQSSNGKFARRKGEAAIFNKAALELISEYPDIQVNDLHGKITASPVFDKWRAQSNVHFYDAKEREFIGNAVGEAVKKSLK